MKRPLIGMVLSMLGLAATAGAQPSRPQPPNILFIQADDLGYGDLSVFGQTRFSTPNIDRLAKEGTRFTQYYAGSTVCAPSRAALMTGRHSGHASIRGNGGAEIGDVPLPAADVTIAEVLKAAGYRTAIIGKWGLGQPGTSGLPNAQGFDLSFGFLDQRHAHRQFTDYLWRNGERVPVSLEHDYANDLFTIEAAAFMAQADARPFFVYLNYTVPHAEERVPDDSMAPFKGKFEERPFVNAAADAKPTGAIPNGPSLGYRSQPTPFAAFAGMITRMDRDVGRLVEQLNAQGIDRRTLVFFTSDNGPHQEGGANPAYFHSAGPLRGIKRDLYEGGIRVPMIARWPGTVPAGRVSDQVWAHWDVLPTLAAIAGARVPDAIDGVSVAAAITGKTRVEHAPLYWEFHERGFQQAVRMGRWKAVRLTPEAALEIYDLDTDLGEQHDVAAAHPDVVRRMEDYLKTARTESALWPAR